MIGLDTDITKWLTVQEVDGYTVEPVQDLLSKFGWSGGLIITDSIRLAQAIPASPDDILADPQRYALRRVVMDTTYAFGGVRLKDSPILEHVGLGFATDRLGSVKGSDYLGVIDVEDTETQIRDADVFGAVLFPSEAMIQLLVDVLRIDRADLDTVLSEARPAVFFESLEDDEAELRNIAELAPTLTDPTPKLHRWHGQTVSIEGIGLGGMVRSEDIPPLKNSPIQITGTVEGVIDLTGAMALAGLSSADSGETGFKVGHYRYELAVHAFDANTAFAFVVGRTPVPLDPVADVARAEFGDRVRTELTGYKVVELPELRVTSELVLAGVDLLIPVPAGIDRPVVLTNHPGLVTGDNLATLTVDGYLIDAGILDLPGELRGVPTLALLVAEAEDVTFSKAVEPQPPTPTPVPPPTLTPLPLLSTPTPVPLPPTPTFTPVPPPPTPTLVPPPTFTPVPLPPTPTFTPVPPPPTPTPVLLPPTPTVLPLPPTATPVPLPPTPTFPPAPTPPLP